MVVVVLAIGLVLFLALRSVGRSARAEVPRYGPPPLPRANPAEPFASPPQPAFRAQSSGFLALLVLGLAAYAGLSFLLFG